ncbi:MAG: nucleoside triphosphate pyrophosphohydrolase [Gemmatimonadales bacterium]|nr:MAG: nucleoside triphosphate pyrophosphohydrolase [Gemmatimonadales bacterium]
MESSHVSESHRSPAEIADAGPFPATKGVLDRALALVEYLRAHCPWDARQTARSLVPHLLEETHETVEAIQGGNAAALRDELGDLLLNLAFQFVVAEDEGSFTREEVVRGLEEKMIRRHPHLFGLGDRESWEAVKARERALEAPEGSGPASALSGLTKGMSPLLRAHRIQEKVAGVGFDWEDTRGAVAKVREELAEVEAALEGADREHLEEELGDLLFSIVNVVRLAGCHPVPALDRANRKFEGRFRALERAAAEAGVPLPGSSLEELDRLWDEVKRQERLDSAARVSTRPGDPPDSEGASPS